MLIIVRTDDEADRILIDEAAVAPDLRYIGLRAQLLWCELMVHKKWARRKFRRVKIIPLFGRASAICVEQFLHHASISQCCPKLNCRPVLRWLATSHRHFIVKYFIVACSIRSAPTSLISPRFA